MNTFSFLLLAFAVWLAWDITNEKLKDIIMTQKELADGLTALTAQQGKIATEQAARFDAQALKIQELTDAINAGGTVTPEVQTALDGLKAATQALDDTIPDAPAA